MAEPDFTVVHRKLGTYISNYKIRFKELAEEENNC